MGIYAAFVNFLRGEIESKDWIRCISEYPFLVPTLVFFCLCIFLAILFGGSFSWGEDM